MIRIVMAYVVVTYIAMARMVMARIVMAHLVMAYIAMARIVMARIVMARGGSCVAKLFDGVSSVILVPTVLIVSRPIVRMPKINPTPAYASAQNGMSGVGGGTYIVMASIVMAYVGMAFVVITDVVMSI